MESSPLDYVAQSTMDLSESLIAIVSPADKEVTIKNHIKQVWNTVPPLEDFRNGLQWVNVSEPISLEKHCSDKIVVLDFWTYCCINCYHVLPDLANLEEVYKNENTVVVIGVHCAKFSNEKESANILAAVERYNIHHPVVNDADSAMWDALGIRCWPTLLVLGPNNKPLFIFTGEGHGEELIWYIDIAAKYFGQQLSNTPIPINPLETVKQEDSILRFPSKVALNPFYKGRAEEPFLAISDTGNHRVLLTDFSGSILRIIGGTKPGFKDGHLSQAKFDSPQGLCWLSSSVLVVCDTNNHSLRTVHLDEDNVDVLAGTGVQGAHGDMGGNCLAMQALSSPWDVLVYTTPDMDMSVRPVLPAPPPPPLVPLGHNAEVNQPTNTEVDRDKKDEKRRVLLVACAGSHQLWAVFLDTTIWWKYKTYTEGTCVCVAGSGAEAARNSSYPQTAAFAQPSGLALRAGSCPELYIADSESSSIRRLSLASGQVFGLCGGDKNPMNLFAYGDVDDVGQLAKLQHPLGVAYSDTHKALFIADTYNHKIKRVDVSIQKVTSILPTILESSDPVRFNEPSGLSVSMDGKYLYIADTNNHSIKVLNIAKNACHEFNVRLPEPKFIEPENLILYKNDLFVNRKCGNLIIYFDISLEDKSRGVKFTPGAPQNWYVCVRDRDDKDVTFEDFEFTDNPMSDKSKNAGTDKRNKGNRLPGRVDMKLKNRTEKTHYRLYLSFNTALCDANVCFSHSFTIRSTILVRDSVKMVESYKITCKVNPVNRNDNSKASKSRI